MNCNKARQLISVFLDHELDSRSELELNRHLFSCPACRAELQAQEQTHEVLGVLTDIEPSFIFADVKARVAQQHNSPTTRTLKLGWIPMLPRWTSAIAVAASILLGTLGGLTIHTVFKPTAPHSSSDVLVLAGFDDPVANALDQFLEADY